MALSMSRVELTINGLQIGAVRTTYGWNGMVNGSIFTLRREGNGILTGIVGSNREPMDPASVKRLWSFLESSLAFFGEGEVVK
jgi:hypothetical protein